MGWAARREQKNTDNVIDGLRAIRPRWSYDAVSVPCHIAPEFHAGIAIARSGDEEARTLTLYRCQLKWWLAMTPESCLDNRSPLAIEVAAAASAKTPPLPVLSGVTPSARAALQIESIVNKLLASIAPTESRPEAAFESAVAAAVVLLQEAGLSVEASTKSDEFQVLIQVDELPDLFFTARDELWWLRVGNDPEQPEPEDAAVMEPDAIARLVAVCVIKLWLAITQDPEAAGHYRESNASVRHIQPCVSFFSNDELLVTAQSLGPDKVFSPVGVTLLAILKARTQEMG